FPELLICPQPINYQAVYVGFFKGEHFEVEFTEDRPKRRLTLDNPPRRPATPKGIADHSGNRNGRMTALYWVAPTKNKKPERVSSWWCVKCDCGRYELRKRLFTWRQRHPDDMCEICEREQEIISGQHLRAPSKKRTAERMLKWAR